MVMGCWAREKEQQVVVLRVVGKEVLVLFLALSESMVLLEKEASLEWQTWFLVKEILLVQVAWRVIPVFWVVPGQELKACWRALLSWVLPIWRGVGRGVLRVVF